ncbi:hypothetical protein X975_26507, partial [Stegodyphus mimosarum]
MNQPEKLPSSECRFFLGQKCISTIFHLDFETVLGLFPKSCCVLFAGIFLFLAYLLLGNLFVNHQHIGIQKWFLHDRVDFQIKKSHIQHTSLKDFFYENIEYQTVKLKFKSTNLIKNLNESRL